MSCVEVKGLVKKYGDFYAVNNVDFSFNSGKLTAICGKNGSGKTTSIKCLLGLLKADEGKFLINGSKQKLDYKNIGYLPEERGLFLKERIDSQLEFLGKLKGMNKNAVRESMDYWLNKFEISQYKTKKLESLSKGNQQKIQMIATLIHDPEIIILDEPFSGLDPVNMQFFINIIKELKEKGKCILVSSHQLALIEEICEDVCIINKGKCLYSGSIIDLQNKYSSDYLYFSTKSDVTDINAEEYAPSNYRIMLKSEDEFKIELEKIMKTNIKIESIGRKKSSLQEIFVELVSDK
ncbi:MAG: ATP-binding cassette domain-containing protein [Clostridium sp.]|nr:ATP-binding cassette domain-containing protein [Clostridium sp.]